MEFRNDWDFSLDTEEEDFCDDVCTNQANADSDTIFDCGCILLADDDEGDNRSDFEQAGEWLASAGWGTDEDYGSYGGDEW